MTVSDNHFVDNIVTDIVCALACTATISRNALSRTIVFDSSSADIVDNIITSSVVGVAILNSNGVTLSGNVVMADRVGMVVQGQDSSVTLNSGTFSGSAFAALRVLGGGHLMVGLDGHDVVHITDNGGVGIWVDDDRSWVVGEGSTVELNSDYLNFENNAGGDVIGPVIDVTDTDMDGTGRAAEVAAGTDPTVADTDGDGLLDGFELKNGFDPLTPGDGGDDADGDGLSNATEQIEGSDPRNPDTDNDGLTDAEEVDLHHTDVLRADSDGDGLHDGIEVQTYGTDPTLADSDGDGLSDGEEVLLSGLDPLQPGDASAVVNLISNGGFEAEGGSLTGWTRSIIPGAGFGGWVAVQDSASPVLHFALPLPTEGRVAAIADAVGTRTLTLRQAITIPATASVMLGVDVLLTSGLPFMPPSHQFRIDLLEPALAHGDEVLAPLYRTEVGDPLSSPYRRLLFDLTPYAGQQVVLRFTHNQEGGVMVTGIDNVRLLATGGP